MPSSRFDLKVCQVNVVDIALAAQLGDGVGPPFHFILKEPRFHFLEHFIRYRFTGGDAAQKAERAGFAEIQIA